VRETAVLCEVIAACNYDCELGAATELLLACKCIEIQHDFWGHIKFKMCVGMGAEKVPSVLL